MTTDISTTPSRNWWGIGLWVAQALLAAVYISAGGMKFLQPIDALAASGLAWVTSVPAWFVRFIGLAEVLGAIGLILPAATRILPILTLVAAAGLSLVQVAAFLLHLFRGEFDVLPLNLILLALSLFVLWGRIRKAPITRR